MAGDIGDISVAKCRDLTSDVSRLCGRYAGVLTFHQNTYLCNMLTAKGKISVNLQSNQLLYSLPKYYI